MIDSKRCAVLTIALLLSAMVQAEDQETWQDKVNRQLRNENVTRAVGSIAGALLGTQIGSGRGTVVAVAAGTLAGYWLGGKLSEHLNAADRAGIDETTRDAITTGETSVWENPDTGMRTRVSVEDVTPAPGGAQDGRKLAPLETLPPIEIVDRYFTPTTNLNVRGGPGTEYRVLYTLKQGERVPVIGRAADTDWLLVADGGEAAGFAYAPLMVYADDGAGNGGAVRDSLLSDRRPERIIADNTGICRRVTQEVTLKDGTEDSHSFDVCRQSDGSWVRS